jgi:hypothetical protein
MQADTGPVSGDRLARWTAAAVLLVAVIAAVVSFVHIQRLAVTHGQTQLAAFLLPVSVDGTVAAASLVMLRAARAGLGTPVLARTMLGLAVAATLAANVGYGLPYGLAGALLSGWPAVAFIGCAEMAIGMVRRTRGVPAQVPSIRQLKEALKVGQPVAERVQAYLSGSPAGASAGSPHAPGPPAGVSVNGKDPEGGEH